MSNSESSLNIYAPTEYTGLPTNVPLNPVQEEVWKHVGETQKNVLIISNTGSGKTVCLRMLAHAHLFPLVGKSKKLCYVAPLKALVEEKKRDWTDPKDPYSKLKLAIVTGDYQGTNSDSTINNADIIVITPESLASRLRNHTSEKSSFLNDIGMLAIDEIHLIGEAGRGANLEAALVEFTNDFPETQIVGLSGTVPNAKQLASWLETATGRETILIEKDWRPVKVTQHFKTFNSDGNVAGTEAQRISMLISDLNANPNDQTLICVFKKTFGYKILDALKAQGFSADFHNADRPRNERAAMEQGFLRGGLRFLICTKTLFVGVNLPARRVICTHVEAGGGDIHVSELKQIEGRAGRPAFDTEGDCTYYLPSRSAKYHEDRIKHGEPIISQLSAESVALHFLGVVMRRKVRNIEDFAEWYRRTFAHKQRMESEDEIHVFCNDILDDMVKFRMVKHEENVISITRRGTISAQMGVDPYHLAYLGMNLNKYFGISHPTDVDLAVALGSCPGYSTFIASEEMPDIPISIKQQALSQYYKACAAIYNMVRGNTIPASQAGIAYSIRDDIERICVCIDRLDAEVERWNEPKFAASLAYRMANGVSWEEGWLIHQGASKSEARKLSNLGVTDMKDAKKINPEELKTVFSPLKVKALKNQ